MNKRSHIPVIYDPKSLMKSLRGSWMNDAMIQLMVKRFEEWEEKDHLREYQGALSYWAEFLQESKQKVIVTLDWRDTAGKGSNIKKITEQLNNKNFWVTAFAGIPSSEERFENNWFARYSRSFPTQWKIQFYDRSWYNRAWVEAAMGFCTQEEYNWFMEHVNEAEKEIIDQWFDLLKIYLSIGKKIQKERLEARKSVRKRWKSSPVDAEAQEKWKQYTLAKEQILRKTDSIHAPWTIIDSTKRFDSSIEIIKAIISTKDEIKSLIEQELSIDLSPNTLIVRGWKEELERMERIWEIPTDRKFQFLES